MKLMINQNRTKLQCITLFIFILIEACFKPDQVDTPPNFSLPGTLSAFDNTSEIKFDLSAPQDDHNTENRGSEFVGRPFNKEIRLSRTSGIVRTQ
jgi:hypothetical protein